MTSTTKAIFIWLGLMLTMLIVYVAVQRATGSPAKEYDFTRFMQDVEGGAVREVTIADSNVTGFLTTGESFTTYIPMEYPDLLNILRRQKVIVRGESGRPSGWVTALLGWVPFLLLIGFWVFFMRQMQGGANRGAMSFGKSRARLLSPNQKKVTFKDVAGVDEAREELREII